VSSVGRRADIALFTGSTGSSESSHRNPGIRDGRRPTTATRSATVSRSGRIWPVRTGRWPAWHRGIGS